MCLLKTLGYLGASESISFRAHGETRRMYCNCSVGKVCFLEEGTSELSFTEREALMLLAEGEKGLEFWWPPGHCVCPQVQGQGTQFKGCVDRQLN